MFDGIDIIKRIHDRGALIKVVFPADSALASYHQVKPHESAYIARTEP
jgi:hypothetical protein